MTLHIVHAASPVRTSLADVAGWFIDLFDRLVLAWARTFDARAFGDLHWADIGYMLLSILTIAMWASVVAEALPDRKRRTGAAARLGFMVFMAVIAALPLLIVFLLAGG